MNFLLKLFSLFNKPKSKKASKNAQLRLLLSRAESAERKEEFANALQYYEKAIVELEISFKHKKEGKYYRSKYSEIRFNMESLKAKVANIENPTFPIDRKKSS